MQLRASERTYEQTFESSRQYQDPFNEVELDVIFSRGSTSWRVPAFWRGGSRWTVRFTPPEPGEYALQTASTDPDNSELNAYESRVLITGYRGDNELLRRGPLRVAKSGRYFEHSDGTPFYWLGDTWWTALSTRLSFAEFQRVAADRQDKGFTLIQIVAGLVPFEEEPPLDPGCVNEGGPVWEPDFLKINPNYFDEADRRIACLLDHEMIPAIVGGWNTVFPRMGLRKMQQHWRYIIGRYGSYPVFWIVGGEIFDPPRAALPLIPTDVRPQIVHGWSDLARYVRTTDPYHHPLTVHENVAPLDYPVDDESITDFDMLHPSHFEGGSLGVQVAQLNLHYARKHVTKPLVIGEIGYENFGATHFSTYQRMAFWLSMLNGAAGHTYGADGLWEAYSADKPLHRKRWSFLNWEEGMLLPGSYQLGINAQLLRRYPWWEFVPHPEWITPRGTTLLEPNDETSGFAVGSWDVFRLFEGRLDEEVIATMERTYPGQAWESHKGTFRLPYAAGIPGRVRIIYYPSPGLVPRPPPTVLGLEPNIEYSAFLFEPSLGIQFDLGIIQRASEGELLFKEIDSFGQSNTWEPPVEVMTSYRASATRLMVLRASFANAQISVSGIVGTSVGLLLRYQDPANFVAAIYCSIEGVLYLVQRRNGLDGLRKGETNVRGDPSPLRLTAYIHGRFVIATLEGDAVRHSTPIVEVDCAPVGSPGLLAFRDTRLVGLHHFEVRGVADNQRHEPREGQLRDARGIARGRLDQFNPYSKTDADSWSDFRGSQVILADAFRPIRFPAAGDWIIVLDGAKGVQRDLPARITGLESDEPPG